MWATGDVAFEREVGVELLVETARLWRSLGHHDRHGAFHIDGVTGPDEYSALHDDNLYTNLMAQRNLVGAADAVARHPDVGHALGVDEEEAASWRDAARAMIVPYDDELGVHQQAEGFTRFQEWDFGSTKPEDYPLLLTHPYFDLYRRQVSKQADLVLAMHWRGDAFTAEQKARNFRYYEERTVRDSSLSACTQAVLAAETGHLELAHDYLGEAALVDLHDTHENTKDGVHLAALSGAWIAVVAGFGGMRDHDGVLSFAPRLPSRIGRIDFSLLWHKLRLRVSVRPEEVTYYLREGDHEDGSSLEIIHHGEPVTVEVGRPVTRTIPELAPPGPQPRQPPGREPVRRSYFVAEQSAQASSRP